MSACVNLHHAEQIFPQLIVIMIYDWLEVESRFIINDLLRGIRFGGHRLTGRMFQ